MDVDVRGFHDAQMGLVGGGAGGEGMERDQGRPGAGCGEEVAAGQGAVRHGRSPIIVRGTS